MNKNGKVEKLSTRRYKCPNTKLATTNSKRTALELSKYVR
jgi:hypothetical protein